MRKKPRHILSYWRPELAREMFESEPAFEALAPPGKTIIRPGDVVWVCTRLRRSGQFFLLGRLLVGKCLLEGLRRKVMAREGTAEPLRAVSLMDVYGDIRFDTKNYSDHLILRHGRINPEQFGSPRILTDETVELFNDVWCDGQAVEEFDEVLEEDILHAAGEAGYADPITNKEVEREAVSLVTRWYVERGWVVLNVETENRGYDLLCIKEKLEEHVEVKGTQGSTPSFFMTSNEYRCGQEDRLFVLCVVTEIFSQGSHIYRYASAQVFEEFKFTIRQYTAVPRGF